MSDGINTDAANADKQRPKRGKKAGEPGKPKKEKVAAAPQAVQTGTVVRSEHASNAPSERFTYVFGPQHKALRNYLRCVFEPDKYSARVPATTGGFELYTELWKTRESGTFRAGADGTAVLGLCANNWLESLNNNGSPAPQGSVLGYTTSGAAAIRSRSIAKNYAATFPGVTAPIDASVDWEQTPLDRPTDAAMDSNTRIRLVAMKLSLHSVMAATTSKGEVLLCGSVNPQEGARAGAINTCTWDDIIKTNDKVMTRAVQTLANWKPSERFSIVAIPGEAMAFEMASPTATGYTVVGGGDVMLTPIFHVGALARGMTAGDTISYDITYIWETELAKSNNAETISSAVTPVPASTLDVARSKARPYALTQGPNVHTLPFVETLATVEPAAAHALSKHPTLGLRPAAVKGPITAVEPDRSVWSKLFDAGKSAHKTVTNTGYLSRIPVVGGIVQSIAEVLSNIFD